MVSKQPMVLSISTRLHITEFYLEDYSRRKLKTTIPHSNGRGCLGVTCGYLIFYEQRTRDFWLVNPFTRKELCFHDFPFGEISIYPTRYKGILVFSPSMSGWVFVVSNVYTNVISFSLAGDQARWSYRCLSSGSRICDLHFFKGKIYMIDDLNHLWELRLNPEPTLTLLKMKNTSPPCFNFNFPQFVSSGKKLYVLGVEPYVCLEVDFDEMKWVSSERIVGEYTAFVNRFFRCGAAIKPDKWTHPWTQYKRLNSLNERMDSWSTEYMWYFPHECLIDDDSDMENGALLNILKE